MCVVCFSTYYNCSPYPLIITDVISWCLLRNSHNSDWLFVFCYTWLFLDALLLLLYIYRANMTMIHMYMVSIICIKNINMHCSVYYMCLHRIYIYVFIFPIMHKFQKVKRKNVNLFITSKIHQSGLWESRNYRNLLLLRITGQNP